MDVLINIDVGDMAKAEAFYCSAFGLRVGRRFGDAALELLGGVAPIYLLLKEEGSRPSSSTQQLRTYDRHWTPVHLDVVVDDMDRAVDAAIAAGAKLEVPVATKRWGKLAMMSDPFGNGFCLVQFLGRGYDELASG